MGNKHGWRPSPVLQPCSQPFQAFECSLSQCCVVNDIMTVMSCNKGVHDVKRPHFFIRFINSSLLLCLINQNLAVKSQLGLSYYPTAIEWALVLAKVYLLSF